MYELYKTCIILELDYLPKKVYIHNKAPMQKTGSSLFTFNLSVPMAACIVSELILTLFEGVGI